MEEKIERTKNREKDGTGGDTRIRCGTILESRK
jgi:hypothetical protein